MNRKSLRKDLSRRRIEQEAANAPEPVSINSSGKALDTLPAASPESMEESLKSTDPPPSDVDLKNKLHAWWDAKNLKGGTLSIKFAAVDMEARVPTGTTKRLIDQVAAEYRYRVEDKGDTTARLRHISSPGTAP